MDWKNLHKIQEDHKKHSSYRYLDPRNCLNFCHIPFVCRGQAQKLCADRGTLNICVFWRLLSPALHRALPSNRAHCRICCWFCPLCHQQFMESAVLPAQTNKTLVNPCHYHSFSYSVL